MRKRSRLVILALAMALALVLSSCWQIRLVKSSQWQLAPGDVAVITMDLYPTVDLAGTDGYPIVIVAYETSLQNRGTTFDVRNNYDGREKGTSDGTLRSYLIANNLCSVGGTDVGELASNFGQLKAFRTDAPISGDATSQTTELRVKWRAALGNGATEDFPAPFIILTGIWFDDNSNGIPGSGDTFWCAGSFGGSLLPTS